MLLHDLDRVVHEASQNQNVCLGPLFSQGPPAASMVLIIPCDSGFAKIMHFLAKFNPKRAEGGPQRPTARKSQDGSTKITLMSLSLREF